VGYSISGSNIPGSTVISAILSSTSVQMSKNGTGGSPGTQHTGVALTVTGTTPLSSTAGGATDFHYSPSYVTTASQQYPGNGGYPGSVNGRAGAVVLNW
jgi:hypothetical protein